MNPNRFFDDDDAPRADRDSHIELRIDRREPPSTLPDYAAAENFLALVPYLTMSLAELTCLPLDSRDGFILSQIDGCSNVETILDVCAMPGDEALEILSSLIERGILSIQR
jgi:hypothetical protein